MMNKEGVYFYSLPIILSQLGRFDGSWWSSVRPFLQRCEFLHVLGFCTTLPQQRFVTTATATTTLTKVCWCYCFERMTRTNVGNLDQSLSAGVDRGDQNRTAPTLTTTSKSTTSKLKTCFRDWIEIDFCLRWMRLVEEVEVVVEDEQLNGEKFRRQRERRWQRRWRRRRDAGEAF